MSFMNSSYMVLDRPCPSPVEAKQQEQYTPMRIDSKEPSMYNPQLKKRRRVAFRDETLLYPSDRTEDDLPSCWYNKDELANFKKDRKDVVKILKRANFDLQRVDQSAVCLRGYEPYFSMQMNKATKDARDRVYEVVFNEQARQKSLNIFDPESLRACSLFATQWARDNALELGAMDTIENTVLLCLSGECWLDPRHAARRLTQELSGHATPNKTYFGPEMVEQLACALEMVHMHSG